MRFVGPIRLERWKRLEEVLEGGCFLVGEMMMDDSLDFKDLRISKKQKMRLQSR